MSSFWFILKQQWTIEEISIFSNSSHLEWRMGLSDTILKGTHPRTIPARFSVIWFSGFRGEDLNVIFYQNMPNLHNRYKLAERKIWLILKQQWTIKMSSPFFLFLAWRPSWLEFGITEHTFGRGSSKDHSTKVWFKLA